MFDVRLQFNPPRLPPARHEPTNPPPKPMTTTLSSATISLPTARTVQRAGIGVRYSTVDAFLRRRAKYPVEVSYRHLETITGDAGAPKLFRDQIQLRIYYRIFR